MSAFELCTKRTASWERSFFQTKQKIVFLVTVTTLFISLASFPVHASGPYGETYSFSQSASRIQETNSPGITFVLNVTTPLAGFNYQFSWVVTDPTGATQTTTTTLNSVPSTFTTGVTYPTDFGTTNITYVGEYNITVSQSSPPPTTQAATSDAPGFPTTRLADSLGVLAYTWTSIPPSVPIGNYTVTLTGSSTPKTGFPDTQTFLVDPANVAITQLSITQSSLQR